MSEKVENNNDLTRLKLANLTRLNKTYNMLSNKNNWFYLAIILINVVTLVLSWLFESNSYGVVSDAFENFNGRYLYLLFASLLVIVLLKIIPDYVFLYKKTKRRMFCSVLTNNIICGHYKTLIIKNDNSESLYIENLKSQKVKELTAKEMVNTSSVANKIAKELYYLFVFVLGSIFAFSSTNIILCILALCGLIFNVCITLMFVYFDRFKAKYLVVIAKLCKMLYKLKLVKDYENLYNILVVRLIQYGTVFKSNKVYMFVQICCSVIIKFITHIILFFILSSFNIASWQTLIEVLLGCSILDILIDIIPTPKGTLVYELLFLTLFRTIFISGYVVYGMVLYRVIVYFLIQLIYYVGYLFGLRKRVVLVKEQISVEIVN